MTSILEEAALNFDAIAQVVAADAIAGWLPTEATTTLYRLRKDELDRAVAANRAEIDRLNVAVAS